MSLSPVQFMGTVLQDSPWSSDKTGVVKGYSDGYHPNPHENFYYIPILLFTVVGLFLVLYMHHSWEVVGTVLAHSHVAGHMMRSIMLTLWILFLWMMVQLYIVIEGMADIIEEKKLFRLFHDLYSPQVTSSKIEFGSFLAILLLKAPFLFVFFFRKSTDLHNRKQQLSKTDCRLCYWIRVLCDTLGGIGVVAAVQIASVYLFHCVLLLIVRPTYTIVQVSLQVAYIATSVVVIFFLIQSISSCFRKTCSLVGIVKGVAILMLSVLCVSINENLRGFGQDTLFADNSSDYTFYAVMRSLVASAIIGMYGYAARKMLYQKMKKEVERAEKEETESVFWPSKKQALFARLDSEAVQM